jgi:hypothetical protein
MQEKHESLSKSKGLCCTVTNRLPDQVHHFLLIIAEPRQQRFVGGLNQTRHLQPDAHMTIYPLEDKNIYFQDLSYTVTKKVLPFITILTELSSEKFTTFITLIK